MRRAINLNRVELIGTVEGVTSIGHNPDIVQFSVKTSGHPSLQWHSCQLRPGNHRLPHAGDLVRVIGSIYRISSQTEGYATHDVVIEVSEFGVLAEHW